MKDWTGNSNSIYKTIGASNHTDKEREQDDYYATDPIAVDKLLSVENVGSTVWECAAGGGHLSERLRALGKKVYSTDLIDRGYLGLNGVMDFLTASAAPIEQDFDILTNPPYKYAKEFVLKALELLHTGCRCYMFLKLTFLEGKARFNELFKEFPPQSVYVFSERVLCAKNARFDEMRAGGGSAICYAWFVWEKGKNGVTTLQWL